MVNPGKLNNIVVPKVNNMCNYLKDGQRDQFYASDQIILSVSLQLQERFVKLELLTPINS